MLTIRSLLICLMAFSTAPVMGQDTDNRLDTVLANQKKMMERQEEILGHVKPSEPLANKHFGIEFNPAMALLGSKDGMALSGGASFFGVDRKAEVSIPVYYQKDNSGSNYSSFILDVHYRRFLGQQQKGFYISGGGRYQRLRGEEEGDILGGNGNTITADKFGMMFGIGYRYFTESGFYWGTSLSIGRYFTGTNRQFQAHAIWISEKTLWDFELLKFGYAF